VTSHDEEMPDTPGEWLVQYLTEELGVDETDAVLAWFELGAYAQRIANLMDQDPQEVALKIDAAFGEFVFLDPLKPD